VTHLHCTDEVQGWSCTADAFRWPTINLSRLAVYLPIAAINDRLRPALIGSPIDRDCQAQHRHRLSLCGVSYKRWESGQRTK